MTLRTCLTLFAITTIAACTSATTRPGGTGTTTGGDTAGTADGAGTTTGGDTTGTVDGAGDTTGGVGGETTGTDVGGTTEAGTTGEPEPEGVKVPILGWGTHVMASVNKEVVATAADKLNTPRDVMIDPDKPGDIWIANHGNETMVVVYNSLSAAQSVKAYWSLGSAHFFARPSAIAWGTTATFATMHETDQLTQGASPPGTPEDFMGPTLQSADPGTFDAGHGSHLDMLHNSPNGMGIAWERDNVYWTFDGYHSSITRYDFKADHGKGGQFHGDGDIARYAEGDVKRVAGIPSHMEMDRETGLLYIADTGNNRIAVLDTATGTKGGGTQPVYDGPNQYKMNGANIYTLIDGAAEGLQSPSGLAIAGDQIFVGDNGTGIIYAFDMAGKKLDWLETGIAPGGLMGIEIDQAGNLVLANAADNEVWYLLPRSPNEI